MVAEWVGSCLCSALCLCSVCKHASHSVWSTWRTGPSCVSKSSSSCNEKQCSSIKHCSWKACQGLLHSIHLSYLSERVLQQQTDTSTFDPYREDDLCMMHRQCSPVTAWQLGTAKVPDAAQQAAGGHCVRDLRSCKSLSYDLILSVGHEDPVC